MVEKCFQRYIWYKTEILELESYIQTLDLDSETRAHVTRILTSLKQDRDTLRNAIAGEHAEFASLANTTTKIWTWKIFSRKPTRHC